MRYNDIVTMLCFICGRRKVTKARAGSYFGASLERIKNDYPHISVEDLTENDNLMTARCPWCKHNGFEEPAAQMEAHAAKLVEDAKRLRELIAARKKREAKKLAMEHEPAQGCTAEMEAEIAAEEADRAYNHPEEEL
jgi:hypothetical protein